MQATALSISRLTVRYGPTTALDAADLDVTAGQVHAVLGENGAGKSTIVKVLSGLVRPNAGTLAVFGRTVARFNPRYANALGIRTAFQEISLVKDLTVAQNFMLMEEPLNAIGMIRGRTLEESVRGQLERIGITSIDPRTELRRLDLPSRQKIEIARAVSGNPRILLLDEPTASLSNRDVQWLGDLIERLARSGTTVMLISHRMHEVRAFCSAMTIFRNGRAVGAYAMADLADSEIIELMIGRSLGAAFPPKRSKAESIAAEPILSCGNVATTRGSEISFTLRPGQVLGLAGLDGMGQRELFLTLFGVLQPTDGDIHVGGQKVHLRSPADAIACGIGMLPEDRKTEALFLDLDGRENVSLPSLHRFTRGGLVRAGLERKMVASVLDVVKVARRALWSQARNFSGGNQQKIAVAKWLLTNSRVLLLYDPTRGIDVGTKTEIYHLIRRFADAGGAVLFYSTEVPELVNLCDQVMVIYRGRIVETLAASVLSESAIMSAALGRSADRQRSGTTCIGSLMSNEAVALPTSSTRPSLAVLQRSGMIAFLVLLAVVLLLIAMSPKPLSYFDLSTISASGTALALAGIGETIVVLGGGLDLSPGAVISLVNVIVVTQLGPAALGVGAYTAAAAAIAVGIGAGIGAINGALVSYLRLPSIIVTLATMFVVQGASILILNYPGGAVSGDFANLLVGDAVPDVLPVPILIIVLGILAWLYLKRLRFGIGLYAIGSDAAAARASRVNVRFIRFLSFTIAGAFFGAAGLFITANTGSGDPLIGAAILLKVFAAVVLGGTLIGGGRGGAVGTVFGALTLTIVVDIFLVMGVRTYYVPIVEGAILLIAVLALGAPARLPILAGIKGYWRARAARSGDGAGVKAAQPAKDAEAVCQRSTGWLVRNAHMLRFVLPAFAILIVVLGITAAVNGSHFQFGTYLVSLLTFGSFLAILGLGQGAVVIAGGLDLSVPWAITFPAIVLTTYANGANAPAIWAIPLALCVGAGIGLFNGVLVAGLAISPIIATLATGSMLEGIALVFSHGAPIGNAPPVLLWFLNSRVAGLPPAVWFLGLFVIVGTLVLNGSSFGRRVRAVGNSEWVARLSGVHIRAVTVSVYIVSGLCSAIVGLMLAGFSDQAYYDMGKPYLLASIAVVVLGGTRITGGRGHYIGILGGALLFTAMGSMLQTTSLPEAVRSIIYGAVLLLAVILLRDQAE